MKPTIIAPHKRISIGSLLNAINVLLAFLKREIHVAVDTL